MRERWQDHDADRRRDDDPVRTQASRRGPAPGAGTPGCRANPPDVTVPTNGPPGLGQASPARRVTHRGCAVEASYGGPSQRERREARVPEDGPRSPCEDLLPPRLGAPLVARTDGGAIPCRRRGADRHRCRLAAGIGVCGRQRDDRGSASVRVTVRFLHPESCNPTHSRRVGRYTKETRKA